MPRNPGLEDAIPLGLGSRRFSRGVEFDAVRLHLQHCVRLELVVAGEGNVEADHAFGFPLHDTTQRLLGDGPRQTDRQRAVRHVVERLRANPPGRDVAR